MAKTDAGENNQIHKSGRQYGWRYISFRLRYELLKRTGLLKNKFPVAPAYKQYVTLPEWKQQPAVFFFAGKASLSIPRNPDPILKNKFTDIQNGKLLLFNSMLIDLGKNYDWVTNPDSGFRYDIRKHWTQIADFSKEAGDIKFVWEKSRFSYLYDVIRYDYHFDQDCAALVFADIQSWIKSNPVNCGPNYRCSQEMSLRVLNWLFALYYYRDSSALTNAVFDELQHIIYWHLHHIYNNIDFSRIAVRNNHAITETLTLYLGGIFFPTMPGAELWQKKGKAGFEQEIAYQVYTDGTFLQFSMNYHRILIQLLTWGIALSEKNGDRFSDVVYERARGSFEFLRTCMVDENGCLPNYGANDGALFFKLSSAHYRDYRPQLQALANVLGIDAGFATEDSYWYGIAGKSQRPVWQPADGMHNFPQGGYYVIREPQTLTFIRCGNHKDRPLQADNLHLDIWYKGINVLPDAGSYKYNTDESAIRYFSGTRSHNTVMLGDNDQMLKGNRFIWFYWSQCESAATNDHGNDYRFDGSVQAFSYIGKNIVHRRTVIKQKGVPKWNVEDEVINRPEGAAVRQLWHILPVAAKLVTISAKGNEGCQLNAETGKGWSSSLYGQKEITNELCFSAYGNIIDTTITITD